MRFLQLVRRVPASALAYTCRKFQKYRGCSCGRRDSMSPAIKHLILDLYMPTSDGFLTDIRIRIVDGLRFRTRGAGRGRLADILAEQPEQSRSELPVTDCIPQVYRWGTPRRLYCSGRNSARAERIRCRVITI